MTATAARLRQLGLPHARARAAAVLLAGAGGACAIAAGGLRLAPHVAGVLGAWVAILGVVGLAAWLARRAGADAAPLEVGRLAETAARVRAGSVVGLLAPPPPAGVSADLLALADRRAAQAVERAAPVVSRMLARGTWRGLVGAGLSAAAGAALFVAAAPGAGRAAAFWHPLRTLADARAPVRLSVDRATVRRGDSITVTIDVPAASRATLWTRGPGEPWRSGSMALDSAGHGARRIGPLQADLFLKASSGGRTSGEHRVTVALPAFVAELQLTARYPGYLGRADEPLVPGVDTIAIPEGTVILTNGAASVPVASAAWRHGGSPARARLAVHGSRFSGRLEPLASGSWRLDVATADGGPLEGEAPELRVRVVPDSAPLVMVPVPGGDTTLPLSLRQPLVIDVRDDHGLSRLEVVSWRVSQTGKVGQPLRESLDVSGVGDRAIVQGELDAGRRGLLPGDTLRLRVEAWDNAPTPHAGRSAELALRLPSLEELRAATRAATRDLVTAADSIAASQRDLGDRTRDLAQERSREAAGSRRQPAGAPSSGTLPFQATERAQAVAREQEALERRVAELSKAVEEIARAAQAAGIDDTAFQQRLREVQEMLRRAVTPELEQRLRELQEALAKLDPEATRQALQRLAEAQQQLKAELERSRELFRRAAAEGALASLAADADDLKRRQAEWNQADAVRPDSAAAARERLLAERADSLAAGIEQVAEDLGQPPAGEAGLAAPQEAARRAHAAMRQAAQAAEQGEAPGARAAGAQAEEHLEQVPGALRAQRDSLASAWRTETLAALDRALSETAALAGRQQQVAEALRRGESSARTRSQQAAVEEGTAAVERQIREAAGKHALVSPQLEAALGFAKRQMAAARQQLEQGDPNTGEAAALAEEAVDALNATALALARSRGQVAGAQSGSGFAEAVEQLARLARDQSGLNGQARGLLPMMGMSGQAVLEQLRALAARQRALAEQLERLQAAGGTSAAGQLAQEARELARQLDAGRLDQQTIRRQERLYRRLLDAGRTLSGSEPDEQRERVSRPASGDSVHVPEVLKAGATGAGPKLRYPTWEALRSLTPEQRRLVLEYFRRLNAPPQ
ncbi:MAG TPA: hypothetical protein VFU41_10025 [Gemmatimonadales bacterium]|nr:hypothetical protein [Gemmatimonadales bacterium]